ncbi:endonuclease [Cohnella sp. AR92]|uniref:endonuclease n=1 Tax=Cohnella sp. AR92 TaxID=648716 RepID=UPI000F8CA071|nr:endonuclease [Cohnella sp. AR92]RUS45171.1 endonuclease [Cohnella sp. AR92]
MKNVSKRKLGWAKLGLALTILLPGPIGLSSVLPSASAEGPSDPAPFINAKVTNGNAGKKVLFDNTHAQTSGAADWVIDGGFSDFGNALAGDGFYVKELRKATPFTYDDLADYDVFVVAEPNIPFKTSEQAAMKQYVEQGGSIFFIGDHYNADRNKNRWDGSESINGYRRGAWDNPAKGMDAGEAASGAMQDVASSDWLADNFGIRFRYNALGDLNANNIVAPSQAFGITEGVSGVAMHAGSTLAIVDPTKAKGIVYVPQTNESWASAVDQGVYNGGGVAEGPYVAVSKLGAGKAAFIGDSSPVEDITPKYLREDTGAKKTTYDGFKELDDGVLLVNLVNWLSEQESYTAFDQVPGLQLDQPTALYSYEQPAYSTEPQAEPWAAPNAGYLWYDRSTFKPGSYGGATVTGTPAYSFTTPASLSTTAPTQIRVNFTNLPANSTVSGFQIGVYLTGGTQVGKIQNADGTWPSSYGYSASFSVTTDSAGSASKQLNVQINPTVANGTSASLRLRQNSTNLLTNTVTISSASSPGINDPITIAEARAKAEGASVIVEGVVTTEPGAFGGQTFYLQDGTGGLYIYQTAFGYHKGDKLKIKGSLALYNTELELSDIASIEKTGTAALPDVKPVTFVDAGNQGQLVSISNAKITNIVTASPAGSFEFDAVNEDGTNHVRVDTRTGLSLSTFPYKEGQVVDIQGVSAVFKGLYQLKPLGLSDFTYRPVLGSATLSSGTTLLKVGDTGSVQVSAELSDGTAVDLSSASIAYSSSDPSVTVDGQGSLKAVQEGTAEVTASVTLGSVTLVTNPVKITVVQPLAGAAPGKPVLTDNNGFDNGLRDGSYAVTMDLWWGNNGSEYKLYENGKLIADVPLTDATPSGQHVSIDISGKPNGTYVYTCELINVFGSTACDSHTVTVTDANPGKPVLSQNNWDGDGNYTIWANLWWGTNGSEYKLYENGVLVDDQALTDATPGGQQAGTAIEGRAPGTYEYRAEWINAAGITVSDAITVTVTH